MLVGPDLVRTRQVAQPGSDVDRVAITVFIDELDFAARHADADRKMGAGIRLRQPLLVIALHFDHGVDGIGCMRKHRQHAITQGLDHASPVRDTDGRDPLRELGHDARSARASNGLENPGAPHQVGKHDGSLNTHALESG